MQHSTCSAVKPLSRRCLSKDIIFVASDCLGAYFSFSPFVSLTVVCLFRGAEYLLLTAGKPGNSNSTQKIVAVVQMNRMKANRASRENLCIMHSAAVHSRQTAKKLLDGAYRRSLLRSHITCWCFLVLV